LCSNVSTGVVWIATLDATIALGRVLNVSVTKTLNGAIMTTKFDDLRAGDKVIANGTHKCLRPGQVLTVWSNGAGSLSVECNGIMGETHHILTRDADGNLVGFAKFGE
jgi:hypothetical protein